MMSPTPAPGNSSRKMLVAGMIGALLLGGLGWYFGVHHPAQRVPPVQQSKAERPVNTAEEETRRKAEAERKQAIDAAAQARTDAEAKARAEAEAARRAASEKAWADAAEMFDSVIARGKEFEIKRSQLDRALSALKVTTSIQGRALPPAELRNAERRLLDFLIQVQLFNRRATDAEKARGRTEGDRRFEEIRHRAPSDEALARQLKAVDWTLDQFHERLVEEATAQAVLLSKIKVTDEQVQEYYDRHGALFDMPEAVRVTHILVFTGNPVSGATLTDSEMAAKKTRLEGLLKRARNGEDFSALAREFSEDPTVKVNGGEATFERRGQWSLGMVPPEVEAAAFSLKPGQISYVITSALGYHLIKLNELIPAHRAELAKVSAPIRDRLESQESEKILPAYYRQLKREAGVVILDEKLKGLEADADRMTGSTAKVDD